MCSAINEGVNSVVESCQIFDNWYKIVYFYLVHLNRSMNDWA